MGKYSDGGGGSYPLVAVCIDKDKNSQNALKYATETLAHKGQTIVLVHVNTKGTSGGVEDAAGYKQPTDPQMKDLFLPFRCFCTRKDIHCKDVVLDDHDVAKSIVEFAAHAAIEKLVVGASARSSFVRFKAEICSSISKAAPDFCTVYVVSKGGKVTSVRQAVRQAPAVSPLRTMIQGPKPEPVHAHKWTPPAPAPAPASSGTPMFQENHIINPMAHTKLTSYVEGAREVYGPEYDPSTQPIDPEVVMRVGGGKKYGQYFLGDDSISSSRNLSQIRAESTSGSPAIRQRPVAAHHLVANLQAQLEQERREREEFERAAREREAANYQNMMEIYNYMRSLGVAHDGPPPPNLVFLPPPQPQPPQDPFVTPCRLFCAEAIGSVE